MQDMRCQPAARRQVHWGVHRCIRGVHRECFTCVYGRGEREHVDTGRERNGRLAAVMAEAGFSNHGLALRVRELAHKDSVRSSADHVSVSRWLNGAIPRGNTPEYVSQALESKLGRPVPLSEIGFAQVKAEDDPAEFAERGAQYQTDAEASIQLLATFSKADLQGDRSSSKIRWSATATGNVITSFVFGSPLDPDAAIAAHGATSNVAKRIRDTANHLMELDFKVGGGNTRKLLLFYFQSEVVPALRKHYPEAERRAVLGAAAEVAQLLGWTAYDTGRHGVAQRYFVQGLRLAEEAGDRLLGGRLLANMSHQANYLGRFDEAVHLSRAAQTAASNNPVATVSSMFLAMEARALAGAGRSRESVHALHRAEAVFERHDPDKDPEWIGYFNREELAGEAVHCFRDLGSANEARTFGAEARSADSPLRTRAFIGMVNASVALRDRELEEAITLATEAINDAGSVQSRRYIRYLADFHGAVVTNYEKDPRAALFVRRVGQDYPSLVSPTPTE